MDINVLEVNKNFTLDSVINGSVMSTIIALTMVIALVANLFVICITFCYLKSWKQPSTILLTNLLMGDLVLVTVMPFGIISNAYGGWIFGQSVEEKYEVCLFAAFMFWYSILLITVTLTAISLDRFLFIVKPLIYRRHIYMKPQIAVAVIIIIWIVCAILNTTPLYGFGLFHFSESHGFCVPGWETQSGYVIYILIIFGMLMSCIVVTSIWTCCSTHSYWAHAERRFKSRSRPNLFNNECEVNIYTVQKKKVIGIFGALLLMNAISFAPSFIVAALAIFLFMPSEVYAAVTVSALFGITVGNPVVQVLFRQDIKTALQKFRCSSKSAVTVLPNHSTSLTVSTYV